MMRQSWEMRMMMMVMTMKSGLSKNLEGDRNEVVEFESAVSGVGSDIKVSVAHYISLDSPTCPLSTGPQRMDSILCGATGERVLAASDSRARNGNERGNVRCH